MNKLRPNILWKKKKKADENCEIEEIVYKIPTLAHEEVNNI